MRSEALDCLHPAWHRGLFPSKTWDRAPESNGSVKVVHNDSLLIFVHGTSHGRPRLLLCTHFYLDNFGPKWFTVGQVF